MEDKLLSSYSLDSLGLGAPEERLRAARGAGLGVGAEAWRHRPWAGLTAQASVLPRGSRSGGGPSRSASLRPARGQHGTADGAGRLQRLPRGKPSALPDLASPTSQLLGPPRPTPHLWIQACLPLLGSFSGVGWVSPGSKLLVTVVVVRGVFPQRGFGAKAVAPVGTPGCSLCWSISQSWGPGLLRFR